MNKTTTGIAITILRTINAPRQKVFDAWTQPEHLRNWWRCDPDWSTEIVQIDLRVGGQYRLGIRNPEKDSPHVCYGEFQEIDPPHKLVYTWSWESPGMDAGQSLVTVEFHEQGGATELVLTHEKFPHAETAAEHNKGWNGCLDQLVRFLESQ